MTGHEIIVGVTGGIACYKAAALVSQLVQAGAGVTVVMTEAAGKFIGSATFEGLTGRRVLMRVFDDPDHPLGPHIRLAEEAKLLVIAPATANFLAKAAHAAADDLLSTLYVAFPKPVIMAPAMNNDMWANKGVQRNVAQLRADGVRLIDPEEGWLSCRRRAIGRMAAPEKIVAAIKDVLKVK
jgi:phosphopantothenoylcysteine decarboxylase/phosphopantothenate--cysteine ligase